MKKAVIILSVIIAVLLAAGGVGGWFLTRPEPPPVSMTVTGTLTIPNGTLNNEECILSDGFGDIHEGAQVVVKGGAGKTVGVGELGVPSILSTDDDGDGDPDYSGLTECIFPFTLTMRPDGSEFYSIRVGGMTRGSLEYSEEKLRQPIRLTLE